MNIRKELKSVFDAGSYVNCTVSQLLMLQGQNIESISEATSLTSNLGLLFTCLTLFYFCFIADLSGESGISQSGAPTPKGGANLLFDQFSRKLQGNKKVLLRENVRGIPPAPYPVRGMPGRGGGGGTPGLRPDFHPPHTLSPRKRTWNQRPMSTDTPSSLPHGR